MTTTDPTPVHRRPSSCHVCGAGVPAREGATRPDCWHDLTNAEADAAARDHDARTTVVYPGGQSTAEAAYVDSTRGR